MAQKSVEDYIDEHPNFSEELKHLRNLILTSKLKETIKWGAPVYTLNSKNVVGLSAFKHHFGLWFFNGVFLKDKMDVLVNAQENKTKALRQMRFNSKQEIKDSIVLDCINEAVENQEKGLEFKPQ